MPRSAKDIGAPEVLAETVFDRLRKSRAMAKILFGEVTEESLFGIKERAYPDNDLDDSRADKIAAMVLEDLTRARCLAQELLTIATPADTFEIFDDAFINEDD